MRNFWNPCVREFKDCYLDRLDNFIADNISERKGSGLITLDMLFSWYNEMSLLIRNDPSLNWIDIRRNASLEAICAALISMLGEVSDDMEKAIWCLPRETLFHMYVYLQVATRSHVQEAQLRAIDVTRNFIKKKIS